MMKKSLFLMALAMTGFTANAAEEADTTGYEFTTVKANPITSIKNQNRSSTCWSFSGTAFLESELIRMGKGEYDLAEMFVVHHCLTEKAEKFVRLHGHLNFAPGGSFHDVLAVLDTYGAVPEEAMTGLNYGEEKHVHSEMDKLLRGYVDNVVSLRKLTTAWKQGFTSVVDAYLGEVPAEFTYQGKSYTPQSFAQSLGLDADDYVSITSFSHHPFYTSFPIEIQDNWRWADSYNVPLDEMMQNIEQAVMNGYTVAWGADVSESGFNRDGIGIVPAVNMDGTSGSDQDRWVGLSRDEKAKEYKKMLASPCDEIVATQEQRQLGYDNYETTDDHGMLIYGIAKDQTGKKYYMVKNSWSEDNKYKGTWYVSENFVRYKTINVVLHKDALTKATKSNLKVK